MPLSTETVPNRMISGLETAQIIEQDVHDILARDGVLQDHIAFQQVSYKVTIEIMMNNPTYPKHEVLVNSRPKPEQHEAIKPFPLEQIVVEGENPETGDLEPVETVVGIALERTRTITNPNKERIKRGMPVTVKSLDEHGHPVDKKVKYDKSSLSPEDQNTEIGSEDKDITPKKRKEWGWDKEK